MTRVKFMTGATAVALAAALWLTGCSSAPKEQDEARRGKDSRDEESLFSDGLFAGREDLSRAGLAVPPDLLDSSSDKVQASNTAAGQSGGNGTGTGRVLPTVTGAEIKSDANTTWLAIDADAEVVWRKLTEFWAFEEIELAVYQPEAGVMETDWFAKTKKASGKGFVQVAGEFFEAFTSRRTAVDKFTIRLQRDAGGTRLYATHRTREKISKEPNNKQKEIIFEWVEREQDAEKIAQLLQTLVLLFEQRATEPTAPAAATEAEPA